MGVDLDVEECEILFRRKHLIMDKISDIVDNNISNEESNVNLSDIIGIVNLLKTNSLEEKMKS